MYLQDPTPQATEKHASVLFLVISSSILLTSAGEIKMTAGCKGYHLLLLIHPALASVDPVTKGTSSCEIRVTAGCNVYLLLLIYPALALVVKNLHCCYML